VTERAQDSGVMVECFGGHTMLDVRQCREKKVKMPTTMSMMQDLIKRELGGSIPLPRPPPADLGKLPSCLSPDAVKESATRPVGERLNVPDVVEMGYTDKHPLSETQFPGGETQALERLERVISEPQQRKWVCEFQKPKTASTNIKTRMRLVLMTGPLQAQLG